MIVEFVENNPKLQGLNSNKPLFQCEMAYPPLPGEPVTSEATGMIYHCTGRGWVLRKKAAKNAGGEVIPGAFVSEMGAICVVVPVAKAAGPGLPVSAQQPA